jgi:hypothetical protein
MASVELTAFVLLLPFTYVEKNEAKGRSQRLPALVNLTVFFLCSKKAFDLCPNYG